MPGLWGSFGRVAQRGHCVHERAVRVQACQTFMRADVNVVQRMCEHCIRAHANLRVHMVLLGARERR